MTQHLLEGTPALQRFSIERLIRLAFRYRLITDYRMTPALLQLYRGEEVLNMDPETARRYLCRTLRDVLKRENASETSVGQAYQYVY